MNARDFHELAVRLAAGNSAAEHRAAVGRSYYAVFNVADLLREFGFRVGRGAAAHGEVQKCLYNSGDADITHVASELGVLHALRNRADYQLDKGDVEFPANATQSVDLAVELIAILDRAGVGPNRPQIQATIAAWRRANGYP